MKSLLFILLLASPAMLRAAIEVRLSIKFVEKPDGTPPQSFMPTGNQADISTRAGCDASIAFANNILASAGRGYVLKVVEYHDIQPPPPSGQPDDYWYSMNARANSSVIERAAFLNPTVWRYNASHINIYINNSSSGQCCGAIQRTITVGRSVQKTTLVHEVGHLLGLPHTHQGDDESCGTLTPPLSQYLNDGDGLPDTPPDSSCFLNDDGRSEDDDLSQALYSKNYAALTAAERARVDASLRNVMSYHSDRRLFTSDQMDRWTDMANLHHAIGFAVSGRTVWVDRNNNCTAGLPPDFGQYQWWVDDNALPTPGWGDRLPAQVTVDPSLPEPPFGYPPAGPRPPANLYPSDWPWPPTNLPAITFCIGGPVKTVAEGITLTSPGDNVVIRPGTYNVGSRLTGRVSLRSSRGTARLVR